MLKLFRAYMVAQTIYGKFLKPIYNELKKDAEEYEQQQKLEKRKNKNQNAKHQKPKRSY